MTTAPASQEPGSRSAAAFGPGQRHRDLRATRSGVLVFEAADDIDALVTLLRQIPREVIAGDPSLVREAVLEALPSAVVISDRIRDPIGLCALLPPDLPKILIVSEASFDLRCAAARAGIEAVLRRPIPINELSDWLEHFDKSQSIDPVSVLLIDDDVLSAQLHALVLERSGMTVKIVHHPRDALPAIEEFSPDLILMDVEMPDVDGIDLARVIRQSREFLSIPIAFLSAESNERRQMAARECGGDDFIRKPVDLTRLAGLVRLRAERARAMRSLIERDSLTGLLNHGRFKERVAIEWERSRRAGSVFSLAMLDIDHFKVINDNHGHPVGDKVIRALARELTRRLRAVDVVGRYGGEEFAVLLPDTEPAVAFDILDAIRERFESLVFEETMGRFSATFSAGITGNRVRTVAQIFDAADNSLYKAKQAGRNNVEIAAERATR